ncbi:hypothetical protein K491DRAFT_711878 [Lophiostoma macrostomum CBS 122681]|uniref:MYND-type domain-containing protein n=1 Tax=Lophiostoma macrostomum CBS 122681 TaxID=1314788 RepID=A0A6A6TLR1_9PLEO|nr:hypothetical protein K491DRAFT_711878 [Lophiostoma macrostomum CBS 122681]
MANQNEAPHEDTTGHIASPRGNSVASEAQEHHEQPSPSPSQRLCVMCNEPGIKRCTGCRNAQYCSTECQQRDWTLHKLLCEQFADFLEGRPSEAHYRAIVFPVDASDAKPRFMWLKTDSHAKYGIASDQMTQILGGQVPDASGFYDNNHSAKRSLGYTLQLIHCQDVLDNGMPANATLDKLKVARKGIMKGPFVAHGVQGVVQYGHMHRHVPEKNFCDLDTTVLRAIVDWMRKYGMMRYTMPPLDANGPAFLAGGIIPVFNMGPR